MTEQKKHKWKELSANIDIAYQKLNNKSFKMQHNVQEESNITKFPAGTASLIKQTTNEIYWKVDVPAGNVEIPNGTP